MAMRPVHETLKDVLVEAQRAYEKFGPQTHLPDGTGSTAQIAAAAGAKFRTDTLAAVGEVTWEAVLAEEVLEAFAEEDPDLLKTELMQVMAVCLRWIDAIDERSG